MRLHFSESVWHKGFKREELTMRGFHTPVTEGADPTQRVELTPEEERLIRMCKALGNPVRWAIVKYLAERGRCICGDIVAALPLAQSTVSQHLKVLKEAGLIQGEIEGPTTCYCLDPEGIAWFRTTIARYFSDVEQGMSGGPSYFAQVAEQWDALRARMYSDAVRDAALARAALHPDAVTADIGAGTGFIAQGLASRVAKVYVIDNSPEMLAVARKNLAAFDNVEYRLADGMRLPLPDASLDAVLANMYLHHVSDPLAALREMARLLKPGGRLVITDMDRHPYTWLQEEHHDVWLGFDREQVRDWFEAAGLVNVRVEDTGESCCADSEAGEGRAAVTIFAAVGTKPDPRVEEAVRDHYRQVATEGSACCGPVTSEGAAQASTQAASLCCAPSSAESASLQPSQVDSAICPPTGSYSPEAPLSLGCGNPVALAGLRSGEVVLDVGCGAGADVFPAAEQVGPAGRVIGLDVLPEMLERARRIARTRGYDNVEFRQGDALAMPVEDASVDVVMSNCVINLVQDKGKAFREAYRVLKPGGRLAISDIVTDRPFSPELREDPTSWAACVSGALPEAEYVALIAQAGFADITVTRSQAWTAEDGTQVYSLHLVARRPS